MNAEPTEQLPRGVIPIGNGFWNIRGSFKIGGVLDIGTQASLVERANGNFLLLDACAMNEPVLRWLDTRLDGGKRLDAILHLHPFHTLHVRALAERYPGAKLYGTERHATRASDLAWQPVKTNDRELAALFGPELDFSVPEGVALVPDDPNLHFSSVLAFHRPSRTLHVDDTLLCFPLPWPIRALKSHIVRLHPTLKKVLEPRPGAVADFRRWGTALVDRAHELENLCAAHSTALRKDELGERSLAARIEAALRAANGTLEAHERKFG